MSFFAKLHARYAPEMTARAFSDLLNDLEIELFDIHPEYLELSEIEQNIRVEQFFRERYGNNN